MASEIAEHVRAFTEASFSSEWYKHLQPRGSCLRLHNLLQTKPELIHELGPKGFTVLHKGVQHGCVLLVKFILVDMFDDEGYCTCPEHGPGVSRLTKEQLLRQAWEDDITAVQMAVVSGSPKMVVLLKWAIDKIESEAKQKFNSSSEGGQVTPSGATRVLISESVNDTSLVVPNVDDHTIDYVYDTVEQEMMTRVYDLIERKLRDESELMEESERECKRDVDFEFVPVAHVFLHFLMSTKPSGQEIFLRDVIRDCYVHDLHPIRGNPEGRRSMLATLFKILDPRGRTIVHAAFDNIFNLRVIEGIFSGMKTLSDGDIGMSTKLIKECMNSKDGAGRTILHLLCFLGKGNYFVMYSLSRVVEHLDCDVELSPLCQEELNTLTSWCFGENRCVHKPIHLAILSDSITVFKSISSNEIYGDDYIMGIFPGIIDDHDDDHFNIPIFFGPLQLAAFLGRPKIIEEILKDTKLKPINDLGINPKHGRAFPAIHCAALSGQVEAIQSILKSSEYDPLIQQYQEGTALHLLLKRRNFNQCVKTLKIIALRHVLPNSKAYARLKFCFSKLHFDEHEPQMFSANESSCINLLLQAGIDIWTPHWKTEERPSPGPMANDKAREWWYNKVVTEVVTQKTSINNASNATSVIATLVATASFIGPLQPPLGLANDGFLHTSISAVRVYFVCNGLSFYFSIASILMAVLPAIPMPKESLYDELFRSQRCLKIATQLLLVSIVCILTSFTSANIAVVSSERHDKQLVGAYIGVGGAVCVVVLAVYMIRMLRMVFHKNNRFRRWFAKNMIV